MILRFTRARVRERSRRRPYSSHSLYSIIASTCVAAFIGLFSGCTTKNHGSTSGAGVANQLRYPLTSDPTTLDPATVSDGTTIDLLQQVFEGLVKWDEKNQIAPNIAEKWDINPAGTIYTFHLKHGVKFHNGRELTAADFKYSMERACDPTLDTENASAYLKDIVGVPERIAKKASSVRGIRVVEPYTLEITLDGFKPYWLGNMTYPCAYAVCREAIEKNGGKIDENAAVGTGPFMLKPDGYKRGYSVTLLANPDYHDGRPKLDSIVRPILKDSSTRLSKFEAGEIDIVSVSPGDLTHIQADPKLSSELKSYPRARIWYIALNSASPNSPFANPLIRKAFAMAIDKKEVIHVGLHDQADVENGILPPSVLGYNPNVKPLLFDPNQARALLAQAGYPAGKGFPALPYTYRNDMAEVSDAAEVVRHELQTNLGVSIQLHPMDWNVFLNERKHMTMPISHMSWGADYLDAQDFLSTLLHSSKLVSGSQDHQENGTGYNNPIFDRLCDKADVEHDPAKRIELYQEAEQIAIDDAAWVPLYFQRDLELVSPRVANIRDSVFGHLPYVTTTVGP